MTLSGQGDPAPSLLHLLYDEVPLEDFDALLARMEQEGPPEDAEAARSEYDVALRLRDLMGRMRSREAELSALYDTASDLTAIRDVDAILATIVRRARRLLHCDMTYLSLNDESDGASYMKVTDGALTHEFQTLRLPLGTGLLGLVAQTGAAYFTEDYATDDRFVHRGYIDDAVAGEQIRAILGVPLVLDGTVIGADAASGSDNVKSVAIYMTVASVITIIAVVLAKETRATSLRHDRVMGD